MDNHSALCIIFLWLSSQNFKIDESIFVYQNGIILLRLSSLKSFKQTAHVAH